MLGVDNGNDGVEPIVFGDVVIHEKRLAYRARVGHAGCFDNNAVEGDVAGFALGAQLAKGTLQIAANGAAHATIA